MKHPVFILALAAATVLAPSSSSSQGIKGREILGLRLGGVISSEAIHESFGHGSELELHFVEGLGPWYGVEFSLSMHNFGRSMDREGDIEYTGTDRSVKAGIYSVSVGMAAFRAVSDRVYVGAGAGIGLYAVTATIPTGIWEGRITRNEFGFNGGADIYYKLNRHGLSLDIGAKYHYVLSGEDPLQVMYAYTGENSSDFIQVTVGIVFFTN